MSKRLLPILVGVLLASMAQAQNSADPFSWLEKVRGARALAWVAEQNRRTEAVLERDPRYARYRAEALAIFTAPDRIAAPTLRGEAVDNLWQDKVNPHGLWRTSPEGPYAAGAPAWTTLIDLDALSARDGKAWFFKGATCLPPAERLCLVRLSDGGGDAVEIREFDTAPRRFAPGGFSFSIGKQYADWIDADTLIVGRDWSGTGADLTASGYPLELRLVRRGQSPEQAHKVFRGARTDVWVQPQVLRDPGGKVRGVVVEQGLGFFTRTFFLMTPQGRLSPALKLPAKAALRAFVSGQAVFEIQEAWQGFPAGSVISYDLAALERDPQGARPELVFAPGPTQAIDELGGVRATRDRLLISLLDNVQGAIEVFAHGPGGWSAKRLPLPRGGSVSIETTSSATDQFFVSTEGFLDPTALWAANAADASARKIQQLPARFDAGGDVVEQHFAVSKDGTRIPYFLVRPRAMKFDGSTPTEMFGYGGFQLSETPAYRPQIGKLWLERGGAYVVANIRGGGEFGPAWHEAAMGPRRQRAFGDFAAVAQDLIKRGFTSPQRLGIYGRSNGGILTSVSMVQHPDLFGAAVIESPLIDMLAYNRFSAGASWMAEYGDPDIPAERAWIAKYSAYENLEPGVKYPEPFVTTITADDRVHPSHARKFAAKLESLGDPVLFYENNIGGHAYDADPQLNADRWARHYVYLAQKLMGR
ncbi:MAG TPA: prolyl oligopeptidase family serine peptidase [Caulobacteraceae bacterium]|nr:prolyl oligopeptidase family serine peptidase [Caulobacteraceae bacterium]